MMKNRNYFGSYTYKKRKSEDADPDDVYKIKERKVKRRMRDEEDFEDMITGDDIDIIPAEFDDKQEGVGNEDGVVMIDDKFA